MDKWDPANRIYRGDLTTAGEMAQYFSLARGIDFDAKV